MSAAPERGAPALYDLALRLAREAPDGLPPEGGFLLERALLARPELLHRWDADLGRVGTCPDEPDTVDLTFWYVPGRHSGVPDRPDRPLAFRWLLPEDGSPPEAQVAAALHRLTTERPTSWARICAGSRERAEELGFTWPWAE